MNSNIIRLRRRCGRGPSMSERRDLCTKAIDEGGRQIISVVKQESCGKGKKITIIGAGFAGLLCGWALEKMGYRVTVLEARSRIGGRVHTVKKNNRLIETGGEFIGLNQPLWLFLANYFGLGLSSVTDEENLAGQGLEAPIMLNGEVVCSDELEQLEKELNDVLMKISDDAEQLMCPSQPWKEPPSIQDWDCISVKDKLDQWCITGKVRTLIETLFENMNLAPTYKQSYLGLLCEVKGTPESNAHLFWDIVEVFRCSNGNQELAEKLAKNLKIICESPVVSIKLKGDKMITKTIGSYEYKSDFVVLTVPPSVWCDIKFEPCIDMCKYNPTMGLAIKWISKLTNRFWIKENLSPNGISSCLGKISEATENQNVLSNDCQNIYLSLFSGGPVICNTVHKKYFIEQMNKLFNYEFTKNLIKAKLIDWPNLKYTETGYSYIGVGNATTISKNLYFPVKDFCGRLIFAGEHTQANFTGYMEGALQSGLRAADEVVELDKN